MTYREAPCAGDWAGRSPIAVVGMGCVLPGAPDLVRFRQRLRAGVCEFTEVPPDRWSADRYRGEAPDRHTCDEGAFLHEIPAWGVEGLHVPPRADRELHRMERALLAAAREAWLDTGWLIGAPERQRAAVVIGFMDYGTPSQRNLVFQVRLQEMLDALRRAAREEEGDEIFTATAALFREGLRDAEGEEDRLARVYSSVAASRIASLLDIHGPHVAVDAACASSMAALDVAIQGLHQGRYDVAVTGAASPQITPLELVGLSRLGLLGRGGVFPFDASARGTLLGEGAGILVLRRLDDAIRDGQRVRAVIRGLGGCTAADGRAAFASSPEGQERALHMAYARAGYGPEAVQYVEAHANGVPAGDKVELEVLRKVFASVPREGAVAVGSVKERIGYLLSAAGVAGLLRTILAIEEEMLPRQISFRQQEPSLLLGAGPLFINTEPSRRWRPSREGLPLRASVSAFGFGGACYHVALESFRADYHRDVGTGTAPPRLQERGVGVVGMGAVLPLSPDVDSFWSNLLTGQDTGVAQEGWIARPAEVEGGPAGRALRRPLGGTGGGPGAVLRAAPVRGFRFSPLEHRLPPKVASRMERSHLWLLEAVRQAVRQAGWTGRLPERTAVLLAAAAHGPMYAELELRVAYPEFDAAVARALREQGVPDEKAARVRQEAEAAFKERLPAMNEDALLGCMRNVAAGRVARALGVSGPAFAVDAGCSSACAALDIAVRGLAAGEYDVAVVAGIWGGVTAEYLLETAVFTPMPVDGARPFHPAAAGAMPGEGAVVLVLQREEDAAREGRATHLRVRGIGASSNGRQASIHALSAPAMARAAQQAVDEAQVDLGTVLLVEAHGACSLLGDTMEAKVLARTYGAADRSTPLRLSCLKATFGNLMPASALAGLVSLALSLRQGVMPPIPNHVPHPDLRLDEAGLAIATSARPWPPSAADRPRRGALSSYSIGGLNYHVVVEAPTALQARGKS